MTPHEIESMESFATPSADLVTWVATVFEALVPERMANRIASNAHSLIAILEDTADTWQPIEMAPKDELLLVWDSYEDLPVAARLDGLTWVAEDTLRELAPTHFRPMPRNPFAGKGAGQ